jgi:hypothetical protein
MIKVHITTKTKLKEMENKIWHTIYGAPQGETMKFHSDE